jgi:multiple sugar transport system permease protein
MTLLAIFTFYPIFNSFLISFYTGYNIQRGDFIGYTLIGNYQRVLQHANFGQAVYNTAMIVFISVPITIVVGLLIAVALNSIKPLRGFYQSIFFLPYVTNSIAIGLVFAFMFKGNQNDLTNLGLVNQVLEWIGLDPIVWIGAGARYWTALSVILVYTVWNGLAFKIIVFLAGIQGIDKQYYQAAQIDGANKSKSFYRITVPMISPMIFYILITSVIGGFKTYSSVVAIIGVTGVITTGATGTINLKTIVFYIYDYIALAGQDGLMSLASAAAIILFGIILFFTIFQLQIGKRRVHY